MSVEARERGSALIMVMWLMVLLAVIVAHFSKEVRVETTLASHHVSRERAYYIARAGIERAILEIAKDENPQVDTFEDKWYCNPDAYDGVNVGSGTYTVRVIDEESKINLNTVDKGMLSRLLYALDVDREERSTIVDSILDWRDEDDKHKLNGAEKDYYEKLDPPYEPKDGPFDSVEELLLVRGVTEDLFYGREGEDGFIPGLVDLLTVHKTEEGINVNTASAPVLEAALGVGSGAVDAIIKFREDDGVFASPGDLGVFGVDGANNANILCYSRNFSIVSTGELENGQVRRSIRAVISRETGKLELKCWDDIWEVPQRPAAVQDETEEEEKESKETDA